ncbi:hypothetical protein ACWDWO_04255 [Actinopolymorpha singaporensis]
MIEAQQLAYRALQEAMDRRDNGGRSEVESEPLAPDRHDADEHVSVR